jgi:hypothetical protein
MADCKAGNSQIEPKINHPWKLYPQYPCSGYTDYPEYRKEIIRVIEYIRKLRNELQNGNIILFHLAIGAAMEEFNSKSKFNKNKKIDQYKQIIPDYLLDYLTTDKSKMNNGKEKCVEICVISPNDEFVVANFKDPDFIKSSNFIFDWERVYVDDVTDGDDINGVDVINEQIKRFRSKKYNITINIFCTMMPHNDEKICNRTFNKIINNDVLSNHYAGQIKFVDGDGIFINSFYDELESLFNAIINNGGVICILSSVAFKNLNVDWMCYGFFKELRQLTKLFSINKLMPMEWDYREDSYVVKLVPFIMLKICYNHEKLNVEKKQKLVICSDDSQLIINRE